MTPKIDLLENIHALASLNGKEFRKTISTEFGRELANLSGDLSSYRQELREDLKIIEGRLQSLELEKNPSVQETLKTVQQLLLLLKKPADTTYTFKTVISKKIVKALDFDTSLFKSLLTISEPAETKEFYREAEETKESKKPTFISVVDNELVLSPALQKIVTDKALEKILAHSTLSDVIRFDFSKCPLLSPEAPLMIKKALKNLDRSQFSCLSEKRFCNATLVVENKKIAVNREFLFDQCGYFKNNYCADAVIITLEHNPADLVRDYIEYLIGANSFSGKKNVLRLLEIAILADKLLDPVTKNAALEQVSTAFESLADKSALERVSYKWLSEIKKNVTEASLPLELKLRTLAFQKLKNEAWKDEVNRYTALQKELEAISKYPDFPDLSDICERLEIEPALDRQIAQDETKDLPYPHEMDLFLQAVSERYPKNYMALNLLGKLEYVTWKNKAADRDKAMHYFERIPMSFAIEKISLVWQKGTRGIYAAPI